jgi:hypothetical protein
MQLLQEQQTQIAAMQDRLEQQQQQQAQEEV